jgi:amino-acid N-acetyltransferase
MCRDGFFSRLGFGEVERGELPLKAWKNCLRCPKFQSCDEITVLKRFRAVNTDQFSEIPMTSLHELVQLPIRQNLPPVS